MIAELCFNGSLERNEQPTDFLSHRFGFGLRDAMNYYRGRFIEEFKL